MGRAAASASEKSISYGKQSKACWRREIAQSIISEIISKANSASSQRMAAGVIERKKKFSNEKLSQLEKCIERKKCGMPKRHGMARAGAKQLQRIEKRASAAAHCARKNQPAAKSGNLTLWRAWRINSYRQSDRKHQFHVARRSGNGEGETS